MLNPNQGTSDHPGQGPPIGTRAAVGAGAGGTSIAHAAPPAIAAVCQPTRSDASAPQLSSSCQLATRSTGGAANSAFFPSWICFAVRTTFQRRTSSILPSQYLPLQSATGFNAGVMGTSAKAV